MQKGRNYGWPVITYGMNYDGTPMTDLTAKEGMEQPVNYWVPSIAVSSIAFYKGAKFPKWDGQLFLGALAQEELRRLVLADGKVTHQEVLFKNVGRVRDVVSGPDGYIYVSFDGGRVARLVPTAARCEHRQPLNRVELARSPLNGRVRRRLPRLLVYLPVLALAAARRRADGRVGCRRARCRRVRGDRAAVSGGHLPAVSQRPAQARRD